MNTSVIRYRVADFLREYPPFDVISLEDLLAFSGSGRVVFHEDDIYLFRKGQEREPRVWMIQQGRIEILDISPAGERLLDVLGPGDLLGLRRDDADAFYQSTARTATEIILYAFDLSAFETLVGKYPETARYLTAHITATARHTKALQIPVNRERLLTEKEKTVWLNADEVSDVWMGRRQTTCLPMLTVREAARQMINSKSDALAVVAENGHLIGLITSAEIRNQIATGLMPDAAVEASINRRFPIAPKGLRAADYLMAMLRSRSQWLAITDSGLAESPLRGIVSDSDLEIVCGRNPVPLLRKMMAAETVTELTYLWQRAQALLSESLAGPSVIEWLSQMINEFITALIECSIRIAQFELAQAGKRLPDLAHCWLLFGDAGRRELSASVFIEIGLVYADPANGDEEEAARYFSMLCKKVLAKLEACGLQSGPPTVKSTTGICQTLAEWKQFFRGHVRDPIGSQIYNSREYFDFSSVAGDSGLIEELRREVSEELKQSDMFIPVLANDTIASLPPLTFHRGFVLETDGKLNQTLDAEKTALKPIADAARVLAFSQINVSTTNTLERLRHSARAYPQYASILTDAAEAWRILSYHQTLAGLSKQNNDTLINPARLSRFEQRMLKTAFDSTRRFLELVSSIFNVNLPK